MIEVEPTLKLVVGYAELCGSKLKRERVLKAELRTLGEVLGWPTTAFIAELRGRLYLYLRKRLQYLIIFNKLRQYLVNGRFC